jgi:hypothetical protein
MSFRPGLTVLESVLEFVAADADVHHNFLEQIVQVVTVTNHYYTLFARMNAPGRAFIIFFEKIVDQKCY